MSSPAITSHLIPKDNLRRVFLLLLFAAIMFFIRTAPLHHLVFTDWPGDFGNFVNFAADDAVYHMRLVHNTIHHFPWRVFFDPFTHFPFGNQIHFGPLFTLIIAGASLVIGLGNPTPALVNIVGAYTPAIMGVLCLIPVYFIALKLSGKKFAIIAAFILTFLPGEFLYRTSLGFTDHHAAEILFSSLTCMFLIYALDKINLSITKYFSWHGILAGFFFGLFVLIWPAALMFGTIFLIFFIAQLLIDHLKNRDTRYLLILAMPIYLIPACMVLPYAIVNPRLDLTYYSLSQPSLLIIMATIFCVCYLTHFLCKKNRLTRELYPLVIAAIFILTIFFVSHYFTQMFDLIKNGTKLLFEPTPGMKTVSEVRPSILDKSGEKYTIARLWYSYFWTLPLALIGFGHLAYRAYKNTKPTEIFLLIWTIIIMLAAIAQIRFNYYLAINFALLAGCYGLFPLIDYIGIILLKTKLRAKLKNIALYMSFGILIFIIADPIIMLVMDRTLSTGQISRERYNTLMWLKKHTPNPQGSIINKNFDYTSGYYPIPQKSNSFYPYPQSAYGIMNWWEMGHQITYIAERIPNANPFQQGVIEKDPSLGAAPFFTNTNENGALKNLDTMGSRYVLIENKTATNIMGIGIWLNDTKDWQKLITKKLSLPKKNLPLEIPIDSPRFKQAMLNRLYYDDANGLERLRLIHESDGNYLLFIRRVLLKPTIQTNMLVTSVKNYQTAIRSFNQINKLLWANKEKTILAYAARHPTKDIKIFEKVKGAVISGNVAESVKDNTRIYISLKLKTKFGRIFTYSQNSKVKNGKYKFVVPYPTTAMAGKDYSYDIKPVGKYKIKVASKTKEVTIPEEAVMLGKVVKINIF